MLDTMTQASFRTSEASKNTTTSSQRSIDTGDSSFCRRRRRTRTIQLSDDEDGDDDIDTTGLDDSIACSMIYTVEDDNNDDASARKSAGADGPLVDTLRFRQATSLKKTRDLLERGMQQQVPCMSPAEAEKQALQDEIETLQAANRLLAQTIESQQVQNHPPPPKEETTDIDPYVPRDDSTKDRVLARSVERTQELQERRVGKQAINPRLRRLGQQHADIVVDFSEHTNEEEERAIEAVAPPPKPQQPDKVLSKKPIKTQLSKSLCRNQVLGSDDGAEEQQQDDVDDVESLHTEFPLHFGEGPADDYTCILPDLRAVSPRKQLASSPPQQQTNSISRQIPEDPLSSPLQRQVDSIFKDKDELLQDKSLNKQNRFLQEENERLRAQLYSLSCVGDEKKTDDSQEDIQLRLCETTLWEVARLALRHIPDPKVCDRVSAACDDYHNLVERKTKAPMEVYIQDGDDDEEMVSQYSTDLTNSTVSRER